VPTVQSLLELAAPLAIQESPPLSGEVPAGGVAGQPPPAGGGGGPGGGGQGPQQFDFLTLLFILLPVVFLLMIFSSGRKQKREQKERQSMLDSLKRQDRVQTVGGVIGTVQEVRNDEVVLKVDETTNTRIRFSRTAIQQVLSSRGEREQADTSDTSDAADTDAQDEGADRT